MPEGRRPRYRRRGGAPCPVSPRSPPELVERFDAIAADFPEATRRLTFGYPCLYVGGNMVSGLFESSWHVKLGPDERRELEAIPGAARSSRCRAGR